MLSKKISGLPLPMFLEKSKANGKPYQLKELKCDCPVGSKNIIKIHEKSWTNKNNSGKSFGLRKGQVIK